MSAPESTSLPIGEDDVTSVLVWRPGGDGPFPAVVVLHDLLGVSGDIARICRRFADSGYVAVAPDLFGSGRRPACIVRTMRALAAQEGRPFRVLEGVQTLISGRDDVDSARIGVVGFCLGGGFAVLHAAGSNLAFVGTFYGEVPKDADEIAGLSPCFAGYGQQDLLFRSHGRRLETHLNDLGVAHDIRFYPDAGHSYMNQLEGILGRAAAFSPMRARYNEDAAEDSWTAMLDFFAQHLEPR